MQVETVTTAPQTTQTTANPSGKHWAGCTLNNWTPAHEAAFLANIQPIADYYVYGKKLEPLELLIYSLWFASRNKQDCLLSESSCLLSGSSSHLNLL